MATSPERELYEMRKSPDEAHVQKYLASGLRLLGGALSLAFLLLLAEPAYALWDFMPTPLEWQSWPPYCRVSYAWASEGNETQFGPKISLAEIDHWRDTLGSSTFYSIHHWCAAMINLERSRVETRPAMRSFLLNHAWDDANYTYVRADRKSPVYPDIALTIAQLKMAMGKPEEAEEVLKRSISAQPQRAEPYLLLALFERKRHHLDQAREVLQQGNAATGGESAEIHYDLGLIDVELGQLDSAVENAKRAYALGYPLPGLKNKLRRAGRWDDDKAAKAEK